MKVAFFSPLPPAKSGIADYSAALVPELASFSDVTTFDCKPARFDPAQFDVALYQIGNNEHHEFCYEMALEHPGVAVIHEANLHHLIAGLTIKRGDWNAYLREVEYDGGPTALAHARRARALEVGPDYDGVRMLRRVLSRSKAAVAHSDWVRTQLRGAGFEGPIARIPHGAWIPEADRNSYRFRLGVEEGEPLIGIFGFVKPYKRITECLRAFRRLVRVIPQAKMILVGEPHPEFPLTPLIQSLDLSAHVRLLGFAPIDDFVGLMAACDIVLNLRYPTVGENSGTLMRALGLGKAVLVSGVGAFNEYPDSVCLKVPVDETEEDTIFEYLNLLASRPEARAPLGSQAKEWVSRECNWAAVARRYSEFLESVASGKPYVEGDGNLRVNGNNGKPPQLSPPARSEPVPVEYIRGWASRPDSLRYIERHATRLVKTLEITPPGTPEDRILEMGAYLQITPALRNKLGYGEVRGCYFGESGRVDHHAIAAADGSVFECDIELFNAEKDPFPYADEYFATVICGELIEHLFEDPMHLMSEVNRILRPGGHLVLTTPNICSLRAISAILQGYHPGFFQSYIRPAKPGEEADARHNREYTPIEIQQLLTASGFETALLETGPFLDRPKPENGWVLHLLERYGLPANLRGDGIYAVGRKTGPVRSRYPAWLYS